MNVVEVSIYMNKIAVFGKYFKMHEKGITKPEAWEK